MTISRLWIPLSAILAIPMIAGSTPAQTAPANKAKAQPQATAALHAIDACEANLEADLSHAGKDDFQEVIKNSTYKTKLLQAHNAVDKVSDPDLHRDLSILLTDVEYGVSNAGIGAIIDRKDTGLKKAEDQYHSDRDLVATEITTEKPGLLRDAVLKRNQKK
jgi:hypothetical protein